MKKPLLNTGLAILFFALGTPALAAPPFEQMDANRDKTISPKEAEAWRPLTRVFERLDKNCDGKLQAIEYDYLLTGKKAPETCVDAKPSVVKIK